MKSTAAEQVIGLKHCSPALWRTSIEPHASDVILTDSCSAPYRSFDLFFLGEDPSPWDARIAEQFGVTSSLNYNITITLTPFLGSVMSLFSIIHFYYFDYL
jgi:hypothetical protein